MSHEQVKSSLYGPHWGYFWDSLASLRENPNSWTVWISVMETVKIKLLWGHDHVISLFVAW